MNRSPLTPLVIPVGEPVKPKTPHRVNADKIRALTNEIIHLRNIVSRMAQRLYSCGKTVTSSSTQLMQEFKRFHKLKVNFWFPYRKI